MILILNQYNRNWTFSRSGQEVTETSRLKLSSTKSRSGGSSKPTTMKMRRLPKNLLNSLLLLLLHRQLKNHLSSLHLLLRCQLKSHLLLQRLKRWRSEGTQLCCQFWPRRWPQWVKRVTVPCLRYSCKIRHLPGSRLSSRMCTCRILWKRNSPTINPIFPHCSRQFYSRSLGLAF